MTEENVIQITGPEFVQVVGMYDVFCKLKNNPKNSFIEIEKTFGGMRDMANKCIESADFSMDGHRHLKKELEGLVADFNKNPAFSR